MNFLHYASKRATPTNKLQSSIQRAGRSTVDITIIIAIVIIIGGNYDKGPDCFKNEREFRRNP